MNDERARDRDVRARLDPILDELSPAGKIELATRLLLDGARDWVGARPRTIDAVYTTAIDAGGEHEREGSGAGRTAAEANRTGAADPDDTDNGR